MNEDFSQRVLDKIEHDHVTPQPRWMILASRVLSIILLILSMVCGAILFSLLLLAILHVDPAFIRASSFGPMFHLLLSYIPFVWIILFALLVFVEIIIVRRGTHGYRYSVLKVVVFVLIGAGLLGVGLYLTRVPERVESAFQNHLPLGARPFMMRGQPLPRPEDGVLFGRILKVDTASFNLEGPRHDQWQVKPQKPELMSLPFVQPDHFVLITGKMEQPGIFDAQTIQPHNPLPGGPPPPAPIGGEARPSNGRPGQGT